MYPTNLQTYPTEDNSTQTPTTPPKQSTASTFNTQKNNHHPHRNQNQKPKPTSPNQNVHQNPHKNPPTHHILLRTINNRPACPRPPRRRRRRHLRPLLQTPFHQRTHRQNQSYKLHSKSRMERNLHSFHTHATFHPVSFIHGHR